MKKQTKIEYTPVTYMMRHSILTQDSQSWPTWDGKTVHRSSVLTSSEATNCVRMLAFNKREERKKMKEANGVPPKEFWGAQTDEAIAAALYSLRDTPQGIFARGHNVEAWLVEQLKAYAAQSGTVDVMHTGKDQVSFNVMAARLSGTPDGLIVDESSYQMHLLEVKSANRWMMSSPSAAHKQQVLQNIGIIKKIADKVGHYELYKMMGWDQHFEFQGDSLPDFNGGQIIYINPANYLETKEHRIEYDGGAAYDNARVKAKLLFPRNEDGKRVLAKPADLPAQGLVRPGGCSFCQHKHACKLIEEAAGRKAVAFDDVDLEEGEDALPKIDAQAPAQKQEAQLLTRFSKAKALESAAKKEAEKLKGEVKKLFAAHGIEDGESSLLELVFDDLEAGTGFNVRRTISNRKGGLDDKALAEALMQLGKSLDDFRKPSTITESISVTSTD